MTGTRLASAEQLADAAWEAGFDVAATIAAAWQARCDPGATRVLVQASNALTSGNALTRLWDKLTPCPSAREFLDAAAEHKADAASLAKRARGLREACEEARDAAVAEHERARHRATRAQAMLASGQPGPVAQAEADAAQEAMDAMRQVIGDCDAALDVTTATLERLDYAIGCLRQAPEVFADAYDVPLQFIADGGDLPWSGDFLTGTNPAETIMNGRQ